MALRVSPNLLTLTCLDNYQGEESDIVVASLSRSNDHHDIGFMSSPQRLNVLLSRARNALILIGNATTFLDARKGKELWRSSSNKSWEAWTPLRLRNSLRKPAKKSEAVLQ